MPQYKLGFPMKKLIATADKLLQTLAQEKESFDKNLQTYQHHLKAQLVSPAMLSAALAFGIALSPHIFPKRTAVEETGRAATSASQASHSLQNSASFFVTQVLRDVAVAVIIPLLTKWVTQKTD